MRITTFIQGFFAIVCIAGAAHAEPSCTPTSTIATHNYPGAAAIPSTNNLLLPTGKSVAAEGQHITIHGKILDARCIPVQEAMVELWQNSPTGRWLLAGQEDLASPNAVFAGAGRTYTDNEGNFTFITAFPSPLAGRAPYVSIKISGRGIPDLSTALYFSDDVRNEKDVAYKKITGKTRSDTQIRMAQGDGGELVGTVELVIPSKAPYRTY